MTTILKSESSSGVSSSSTPSSRKQHTSEPFADDTTVATKAKKRKKETQSPKIIQTQNRAPPPLFARIPPLVLPREDVAAAPRAILSTAATPRNTITVDGVINNMNANTADAIKLSDSLEALSVGWQWKRTEHSAARVRAAFLLLDSDADGIVDAEDLLSFLALHHRLLRVTQSEDVSRACISVEDVQFISTLFNISYALERSSSEVEVDLSTSKGPSKYSRENSVASLQFNLVTRTAPFLTLRSFQTLYAYISKAGEEEEVKEKGADVSDSLPLDSPVLLAVMRCRALVNVAVEVMRRTECTASSSCGGSSSRRVVARDSPLHTSMTPTSQKSTSKSVLHRHPWLRADLVMMTASGDGADSTPNSSNTSGPSSIMYALLARTSKACEHLAHEHNGLWHRMWSDVFRRLSVSDSLAPSSVSGPSHQHPASTPRRLGTPRAGTPRAALDTPRSVLAAERLRSSAQDLFSRLCSSSSSFVSQSETAGVPLVVRDGSTMAAALLRLLPYPPVLCAGEREVKISSIVTALPTWRLAATVLLVDFVVFCACVFGLNYNSFLPHIVLLITGCGVVRWLLLKLVACRHVVQWMQHLQASGALLPSTAHADAANGSNAMDIRTAAAHMGSSRLCALMMAAAGVEKPAAAIPSCSLQLIGWIAMAATVAVATCFVGMVMVVGPYTSRRRFVVAALVVAWRIAASHRYAGHVQRVAVWRLTQLKMAESMANSLLSHYFSPISIGDRSKPTPSTAAASSPLSPLIYRGTDRTLAAHTELYAVPLHTFLALSNVFKLWEDSGATRGGGRLVATDSAVRALWDYLQAHVALQTTSLDPVTGQLVEAVHTQRDAGRGRHYEEELWWCTHPGTTADSRTLAETSSSFIEATLTMLGAPSSAADDVEWCTTESAVCWTRRSRECAVLLATMLTLLSVDVEGPSPQAAPLFVPWLWNQQRLQQHEACPSLVSTQRRIQVLCASYARCIDEQTRSTEISFSKIQALVAPARLLSWISPSLKMDFHSMVV